MDQLLGRPAVISVEGLTATASNERHLHCLPGDLVELIEAMLPVVIVRLWVIPVHA